MRIGFLGDGPWAHQALEKILNEPEWEIVYLAARFPNPDSILQGFGKRLNLPCHAPENINAPEQLHHISATRPDVLVSMSYDQILKREFLHLPPLGVINCHAGALPFYRGRNVLNWVLINGEREFGVTVHFVDEGIDTGDILRQRMIPIHPEDDYATLLDKAPDHCADLLNEALKLIHQGNPPRVKQNSIDPVGFYCGRRRQGDEVIDWNWPAARVHNFIRGLALPGPGARSESKNGHFAFLKSAMIDGTPNYIGTPGEVVGRDASRITVKCGDSTLHITGMTPVLEDNSLGEPLLPKFPIGTRFS